MKKNLYCWIYKRFSSDSNIPKEFYHSKIHINLRSTNSDFILCQTVGVGGEWIALWPHKIASTEMNGCIEYTSVENMVWKLDLILQSNEVEII